MPDDALYDLLAPPPLISLTIKMMMMMMTIVAVEYGMQLMIASAIYTKKNAMDKGVATSMRQDEAIASSCFRRRQIFAHLFHDKANVNFN